MKAGARAFRRPVTVRRFVAAAVCLTAVGLCSGGPAAAEGLQTASVEPHRGGTLVLLARSPEGSIDPQINYTMPFWQLFYVLYDGLVAFRKADGAEGNEVVPDLAEAMPEIAADGRTYVFRLRQGVHFSNGQEVTVGDVAASFRRQFKIASPNAGSWFRSLVGGDACLADPSGCTLDGGIVTDPATRDVTIHLTQPDPEFLYKLATPFAGIYPASAPARDVGTVPMPTTGPYTIALYDPTSRMRLVRNPYFKEWSRAAQPDGYADRIDYLYGDTEEAEVNAIQNGYADWMADHIPQDRLGELGTRYAGQVHIIPTFTLYYAPMNTRIPPFDNLLARQAVNFALDRAAMVKLLGGPRLATPTCQIEPPGFPGYRPYCPYTENPGSAWSAPDLDKARELVRRSGTAGERVTVITMDDSVDRNIGSNLQSTLISLGYDARLTALSDNIEFTYLQNSNNKVQIGVTHWDEDYPAASDFLHVLFGCDGFHPGSDASVNISAFCVPAIDARMAEALALEGSDMAAADEIWGEIDRAVTDQAPAVPLFTPKDLDFVSKRVGNFVYSNQYHWIVSLAWVQ
jgi:peptide/nickel transport system substrate-binding protein